MAKSKSAKVERPASKVAPTGWFSRRYPTSEAHEKAQAIWRIRQMEKAARERDAAAEALISSDPEFALEQLAILDEENRSAVRERQKLAKALAARAA